MTTLTRDDAISRIAELRLPKLDDEELYFALTENANIPDVDLPDDLRQQVERAKVKDLHDPRFIPLLIARQSERLREYTNRYLSECLEAETGESVVLTGAYTPLPAICPCCGAASLEEQGVWEICTVCWWEDDGQGDHNADDVLGGPNGGQSLTRARINYLTHGIFDPKRDDLRAYQVPRYAYAERRRFRMTADGKGVIEVPLDSA
jgi:hypothetical protein